MVLSNRIFVSLNFFQKIPCNLLGMWYDRYNRRSYFTEEKVVILEQNQLENLKQIAKGIAAQFGSNCEVVIHELSDQSAYHSIVAIENGHVTGRKIGDGPSHVVLEQLGQPRDDMPDELCYLTRTPDGKILKSSSMYIRDSSGKICAIFCVNYDISALTMVEHAVHDLIGTKESERKEPERITRSVSDLLDDLLRESVELVGKPVALMDREDKIRAIRFLNDAGALLITKSGDKIAAFFGISKYTLYSYLDGKNS